jgi:hypothetical protein
MWGRRRRTKQAEKLVKAAADELPDAAGRSGTACFCTYVVFLLTTCLRPEEAHALR